MEEITPLLKELAAQLGTTIDFLWGVLIKQAKVYVVIHIVYWVLWGLVVAALVKCIKWMAGHWDDDDVESFQATVMLTIALVLIVATIVLTIEQLFAVQDAITALLNPEYWALEKVLEFIK